MSEDGTRTVLKSWNIDGFMVPVASYSTKNPCQERLLVVFTVPSSGQLLPVKKSKTKIYIYILAQLFVTRHLSAFTSLIGFLRFEPS